MSKFTVMLQASVEIEAESASAAVAEAQSQLPAGAAIQSIQVIPIQDPH